MFGLFKKPPPLPPPEPSVAFAEEAIAIFIIIGLAWVIKRTHDEKQTERLQRRHLNNS